MTKNLPQDKDRTLSTSPAMLAIERSPGVSEEARIREAQESPSEKRTLRVRRVNLFFRSDLVAFTILILGCLLALTSAVAQNQTRQHTPPGQRTRYQIQL